MQTIALVLNAASLLAALAIAAGACMLCSVMFRGARGVQLASSAIASVFVIAPAAWSLWRAVHGAGGILLWLVPVVYIGLAIPLCRFLFGAASAAARP